MKKLILIAALAMTGCTAGHYEWDSKAKEYTNLNFIGIPSVIGLGASGSSTPIDDNLSLTNEHVAALLLRRTAQVHNKCDAAIIAQDNRGEKKHEWAQLDMGDQITFYGYSGLTLAPVSSTGKVVDFKRTKAGCLVAMTTAGGVSGMSGGAVVNSKGKIVGIVQGVEFGTWHTIVIPYQSIVDIMPIKVRDQVTKDYTYVADRNGRVN